MKSFNVIANIQEGVGSLEGKLLAVVTAGKFPSTVKEGGKILIFSGNDADKLASSLNKNVFLQGTVQPWEGNDGKMMFGVSLTSFQVVTPVELLQTKEFLGEPKSVFVDVNKNMASLKVVSKETSTADLLDTED